MPETIKPKSNLTFDPIIPGVEPTSDLMSVTAPFDNAIIGTVSLSDGQQVDTALDNAQTLFLDKSKWLTKTARINILKKLITLMADSAEQLAIDAAHEGGKPLVDSRVEVARAIEGIELCIETIKQAAGTEIPMGLNPASEGKLAFTSLEPIGVVVAVSAFNHPLNLIVHQVVPAIASGCPVIVKPAATTPLTCFTFINMVLEAGLPPGWCQCLLTTDNDVAQKLVTDPRVNFFSFIGSAAVGWMLKSKLSPGTRCALEHGGVAPAIIDRDVDLVAILPKLLKGGFYHAGQVCVSIQRLFVHESIASELAAELAKRAEQLQVGDPTLEGTDVGPLITPKEVDRVEDWVNQGVASGATLLCGGKRLSDYLYAPTVLLNPPQECKVSQLEIFGPVICVYSYENIDSAIELANSVPYSFQASIFSPTIDVAMKAYKRLNASAVMVNEHTAFRVDWMPFAGLKASGFGVGGIPHTMKDMQIEKMLVLSSAEI